jgi:hypothetical protein
MADAYLDGEKIHTINTYVGKNLKDNALWHIYDLEDGPHTVRIVTLDETDARSTGNQVGIQKAIVFRSE